jgi:hypothetical protein
LRKLVRQLGDIRRDPPRFVFGELDGAFGASKQKFVPKSQE